MNDRERGILHLRGLQIFFYEVGFLPSLLTSGGKQDGGIYLNVAANPDQFQPAAVDLARELAARDHVP
ncbi:hypothetical protein DYH09_18040 [bacterium CPR1]|nr:hypothetical protein [bacterium CPR1]